MEMDKVEAMMTWPVSSNLKEVRGFLGLTGYYQKFIWNYAQLARPLTDKLRKDTFGWNDATFSAFIALKQAMTQAPVLSLPDFSCPIANANQDVIVSIDLLVPGVPH